ncbi:hypothetical protein ASD79_01215 [Caulobacter sp. Root655]|uniref:hypothetical protein n=1 Tax=Caulobacter sp. Root655 TaxID=1736578 RepID=UPI0006F31127|nr:hypothetical protein [Caulobacter sp. Root655]KRA65932.1 hypothetical protein ASD79_01215 [Caulobacter sp. Root655]
MALKRGARRWLVVGLTSLALHAVLGWALLRGVPPAPTLVEPPSLVVELLRPTPPPAAKPPPRSPSHAAPAISLPQLHRPALAPPANIPPIAAGSSQIVAPPGFVARGTPTGGGDALRQAARQGGGCNHADILKLSKVEREACAEALGAKNKNGPALYAAIDPDKKAAFDGDCKKDDDWCLYRTGKGPYPGLFALGKKKKRPGWDD